MPLTDQKKTRLRQHFLKLRSVITRPQQDNAAQHVADQFLEHIPLQPQTIISGYYPTKHEISPLPLMRDLVIGGHKTALPVVTGKYQPLVFKSWKEGEKLQDGAFFQIKEPEGSTVMPQVIIVPLLAFDSKGHRLGYGGGFYDRTLASLRDEGHPFVTVGLAYACQEYPALPTREDDIALDYVVTDEKVFRF